MFALDIAIGALRIAWDALGDAGRQRYLLLACQPLGPSGVATFVRQYSEESWNAARRRGLAEATVATLSHLSTRSREHRMGEAIGIRT